MSRLISCPYNPCHQITPERIQYHLVKCAKSHPHADLVICPYNATHHIPRSEEAEHLNNCSDRRIIELQRYRFNDPIPGQHGQLGNPPVFGSSFIPHLGDEVEELEAAAGVRRHSPQRPLTPPGRLLRNFRRVSSNDGENEAEDQEVAALTSSRQKVPQQQQSQAKTLVPLRRPENAGGTNRYNPPPPPAATAAEELDDLPRPEKAVRTTSPYPLGRKHSPHPHQALSVCSSGGAAGGDGRRRTSSVKTGRGGDEDADISVSEIMPLYDTGNVGATGIVGSVRDSDCASAISSASSLAAYGPPRAGVGRGRKLRERAAAVAAAKLRRPGDVGGGITGGSSVFNTSAMFDEADFQKLEV